MKRYLVKSVSVATDENRNHAGQVLETLHGRGDQCLMARGSYAEASHFVRVLWESDVLEYGYTRLCDVKRCFSYKYPQNDKFWKTTVEIVELEV